MRARDAPTIVPISGAAFSQNVAESGRLNTAARSEDRNTKLSVRVAEASKGKCKRCRQEDTASHCCNRHWIVGRHSKHRASHGPDPRQGLVAAQKSSKYRKFLWLPRSAIQAKQVHILKLFTKQYRSTVHRPERFQIHTLSRDGRSL
jgi:hypothetical protein